MATIECSWKELNLEARPYFQRSDELMQDNDEATAHVLA